MAKPILRLGMALYAAVVELAVIGVCSSSAQGAGYLTYGGYSSFDGGEAQGTLAACCGSRELRGSNQNSSSETQSALDTRSAEVLLREGHNCYIGGAAMPSPKTSTNTFYEQSQLKDCLA